MDEVGMPAEQVTTLEKLRSARAAFDESLVAVGVARMTQPIDDPGWSVKDIVAHIAAHERWLVAYNGLTCTMLDDSVGGQIWSGCMLATDGYMRHEGSITSYKTTLELAQIDRDRHYFLEMMPWVWAGYDPIGWEGDPPVIVLRDLD